MDVRRRHRGRGVAIERDCCDRASRVFFYFFLLFFFLAHFSSVAASRRRVGVRRFRFPENAAVETRSRWRRGGRKASEREREKEMWKG